MHYDYVCLSSGCAHLKPLLPLLTPNIHHFSGGEISITFEKDIKNTSVLLLSSMAGCGLSANDHLVETLLTLRALRPAQHITLGLLYGAYTRGTDGSQWMYDQLHNADTVWILDPHTPPPSPIQTRSAALAFARDIRTRFSTLPMIISPDKGGAARAQKIADALGAELCVLHKRRHNGSVIIESTFGHPVKGRICVIVDDVVDSGQTLFAAHSYLIDQGASEVHAYATNGLMNHEVAEKLGEVLGSLRVGDSVAGGFPEEMILPICSSLGHSQLGMREILDGGLPTFNSGA